MFAERKRKWISVETRLACERFWQKPHPIELNAIKAKAEIESVTYRRLAISFDYGMLLKHEQVQNTQPDLGVLVYFISIFK